MLNGLTAATTRNRANLSQEGSLGQYPWTGTRNREVEEDSGGPSRRPTLRDLSEIEVIARACIASGKKFIRDRAVHCNTCEALTPPPSFASRTQPQVPHGARDGLDNDDRPLDTRRGVEPVRGQGQYRRGQPTRALPGFDIKGREGGTHLAVDARVVTQN